MFARIKNDFWFLRLILPIGYKSLSALTSVDEFCYKVSRLIEAGTPMNEREIYLVLREIYGNHLDQQKWVYKPMVKNTIRILWSDMTGFPEETWLHGTNLPSGAGLSPTLSKADVYSENDKMGRRFKKLSFLHSSLPLSGIKVDIWIFDDDFAAEIEKLIKDGFRIDSRTVFLIMRRIYLEKEKKREENPEKFDNFDFKIARSGLVSLWENLTGSREGWRDGEI